MNLNDVIKKIYENKSLEIKDINKVLEREYFTKNYNQIPIPELMQGVSYEDHFEKYKELVREASTTTIDRMFMLLQDYFLFSNGHDMMFKKKLEADLFTSEPLNEFIYPMLVNSVKEKYNDVSVMPENPNYDKNMKDINSLLYLFIDIQTLLSFLYCSDFQFPNGWEEMCPDTHEEVIEFLNKSGMTIGDFLKALIDYKCNIMNEIFSEISDAKIRKQYLERVKDLREQKMNELNDFSHVDLPITYFLNHTIIDFLSREPKSSIKEDNKPNVLKKIILPN